MNNLNLKEGEQSEFYNFVVKNLEGQLYYIMGQDQKEVENDELLSRANEQISTEIGGCNIDNLYLGHGTLFLEVSNTNGNEDVSIKAVKYKEFIEEHGADDKKFRAKFITRSEEYQDINDWGQGL